MVGTDMIYDHHLNNVVYMRWHGRFVYDKGIPQFLLVFYGTTAQSGRESIFKKIFQSPSRNPSGHNILMEAHSFSSV